jgi:UDP-4-amino-4,6-dideoxy-N-acetyl-beta-L-altrosamine N-acetyltransferase
MNLRPLLESDLELVLRWRNAPAVRHHMYTTHEISAEEHRAWFNGLAGDPTRSWFIYEEKDVPQGVVNFSEFKPRHGTAFWGFYAGENAPAGIGRRMEFTALEHAFSTMGLRKLNCEVLAFNTAVLNLHLKFGFVQEGVFREHLLHEGTATDVVRLAIFAPTWQATREKHLARLQPGSSSPS